MIYTIEELLEHILKQSREGNGVYLLEENVVTLATYVKSMQRFSEKSDEELLGRIAWLETTIKRAASHGAMLTQELDIACRHSS